MNGGPASDARDNFPADINGIHLEMRGETLFYVTIAEIGLIFTYTGVDYSWSVKLPWDYAYDNTEGLCGKFHTVYCFGR